MTLPQELHPVWERIKKNKRLFIIGILFALIYAAYLIFSFRITESTLISLIIAVLVLVGLVALFVYLISRWGMPEIRNTIWMRNLYLFTGSTLIGIGLSIWSVQRQSIAVAILNALNRVAPVLHNKPVLEYQHYFPLIVILATTTLVAIILFVCTLLFGSIRKKPNQFSFVKKYLLVGYAFMLFSVTGYIFCTDSMQIGPGQQSIIFYGGTESYITYRLNEDQMSFTEDLQKCGGFMFGPDSQGEFDVYMSSTGFYASILKLGQSITHIDPDDFIKGSRLLFALILAGMLTALSLTLKKKFGLIASAVFSLFPIITYWFIGPAGYLIWFYFLLFIPFFLSIYLYPRVIDQQISFKKFLVFIYIAQAFLFLRGYTYLPGLIAAAAIPVLYYDLQERKPVKEVVTHLFFVGLMGLLGFITAILIHFVQIWLYLGNGSQALAYLKNRMVTRGSGGDTNLQTPGQIFTNWLYVKVFYFSERFFAIVPQWKANFDLYNNFANLYIFTFIEAGIAILLRIFQNKRLFKNPQVKSEIQLLFNLAITTLVALIASWSWFPALGHMAHHYHMNGIMYMIPFGITLFIFTGALVQTLIRWGVVGLRQDWITQ